MVKRLTGEMIILGAKQSCRDYWLRLRIKPKYLSVKISTLENMEKNEGKGGLRRQQLHRAEAIKMRVLHSGSTARLPQGA